MRRRSSERVNKKLTKVFVGGLAWKTTSESLYEHFVQFGDISEAVVIEDRQSGKSRGYGFVTFKEPKAAMLATRDAKPVIDERETNCIMAMRGARKRQGGANRHLMLFGAMAEGITNTTRSPSHIGRARSSRVDPVAYVGATASFSSDIAALAPSSFSTLHSVYGASEQQQQLDYGSGELGTNFNYYASPPQTTFCYNTPSGHLVPAATTTAAAFQHMLPSGNFVLQPALPMPVDGGGCTIYPRAAMPFGACINELALPHVWMPPNTEFVGFEMNKVHEMAGETTLDIGEGNVESAINECENNMLSQKTTMAASPVAAAP